MRRSVRCVVWLLASALALVLSVSGCTRETPSVEGEASLRAVVVLEGDELAANDTLAGFAVKVLPGSMHSVSVGKGDALVRAPMDMSDKQSLAQVLYFPEEIGTNGGKITGLIYKSKYRY